MISFIEHNMYLKHKMPNILESPRRLQVIKKALTAAGIYDHPEVKVLTPEPIEETALKDIHSDQLIELIKHGSMIGDVAITADTIIGEHTFSAALLAVAGTKLAAEEALKEGNTFAFAFVRPPGHHATRTNAMGFCFFNNVAFTANYLLKMKKAKRIMIFDFDNHYGNGTADLFYNRSDILKASIHANPNYSFPFQGRVYEIGEKDGEGYNICIPLPLQAGDLEALHAFDKFIVPIAREYKPEILLVSAGYDGLREDPYGHLSYSTFGFQVLSERIKKLAEELCGGKVIYSLEGGYKFKELGEAVLASISPFLKDFDYAKEPEKKLLSGGNISEYKKTLQELRKMLKPFWRLD